MLIKVNNNFLNVKEMEYLLVDPKDIVDNKITKMTYSDESRNKDFLIVLEELSEEDRKQLLIHFARIEAQTLVELKNKSNKNDLTFKIDKKVLKFDYSPMIVFVNPNKIKYIESLYRDSIWSVVEFNIECSTLKANATGIKRICFEAKNSELNKFRRLGK